MYICIYISLSIYIYTYIYMYTYYMRLGNRIIATMPTSICFANLRRQSNIVVCSDKFIGETIDCATCDLVLPH